MDEATARATILSLLAARAPGATICPSEVARAIGEAGTWRERMPLVHLAVDRLMDDGAVALSWKGERLTRRAGPYRIGKR